MSWRHAGSQSAARGRSLELAAVGYQPETSQSEVRKPDEPAEKRLLTATSLSQQSLRGRGSSVWAAMLTDLHAAMVPKREPAKLEERERTQAACECQSQCNNCKIFLSLFILSLSLHLVTLFCYLDLRSELKREISQKNKDEVSSTGPIPHYEATAPVLRLPDTDHPTIDDQVNWVTELSVVLHKEQAGNETCFLLSCHFASASVIEKRISYCLAPQTIDCVCVWRPFVRVHFL